MNYYSEIILKKKKTTAPSKTFYFHSNVFYYSSYRVLTIRTLNLWPIDARVRVFAITNFGLTFFSESTLLLNTEFWLFTVRVLILSASSNGRIVWYTLNYGQRKSNEVN